MENCSDPNCPIHGKLSLRGRKFTGTVTSSKMHKTVSVAWTRLKFNKKYERYDKQKTQLHAHNPPCLNVQKGEKVIIQECRPLSKTKTFVVIEKLGQDLVSALKEQTMDEIVRTKKVEEDERSKSKNN